MSLWITASRARNMGLTHRAWYLGIVPGYLDIEDAAWVPQSSLLIPVQAVVEFVWMTLYRIKGQEPQFMWELGEEI